MDYPKGVSLTRLLFLIGLALAIILPIRQWVVEPIYIASPSMEPTLPTGIRVFTDKLTPRLRAPRQGDIIVFAPPMGGEHELVKRVIAVPGQTVELREKKVFINGQPLEEKYAEHKRPDERLQGDDMEPLVVPEGGLFVLGDNRDESKDSSVWKDPETGAPTPFLPVKNVRGIVRGNY